MPIENPTTSATRAQGTRPAELLQAAGDLCIRLQSFFELAEREIKEHNNTDFDRMEFLVEAAKADVFGFSALLSEAEDAKQDSEARRAGALACMAALSRMLEAADVKGVEGTAEEYFGKQLGDAMNLAKSLGPMPPFPEGGIIALAEYAHACETTGTPNLDKWKPVCAMTESELEANIAAMDEDRP